jgi:hypothetical protein
MWVQSLIGNWLITNLRRFVILFLSPVCQQTISSSDHAFYQW